MTIPGGPPTPVCEEGARPAVPLGVAAGTAYADGMSGSWFRGPLGKFTWRMLAVVLAGQGLCILLGAVLARSMAATDGDRSPGLVLAIGCGLALLCFAAAGGMRRGWGLPIGWLVQVLSFASAVVVPAMLGVGLIFGSLWVLSLIKGARIDAQEAQHEGTDSAGTRLSA